MLHICNSSAFFKYPYMRLNAVRIGSAFSGRLIIPNIYGLKKIGILKTMVSEVKTLPKNHNIGYSNTYKVKNELKIAVIPCGYKDGVIISTNNDCFRIIDHLRYIYNDVKNIFKDNSIYVYIKDKRYRVIGKVGMYNLVIDTKNDDINVQDEVYIDTKILYIDSKIKRQYIEL